MSYSSSKYIRPEWIFRGWLITNLSDYLLEDSNSPYLRNVRISWEGASIRKGYVQFGDTLTNGTVPQGITSFPRSTSANDRIIVNHNADLISINAAWTQEAISTWLITSDSRMDFTAIWDALYCMNWVDLYWKLTWTPLAYVYANPASGETTFRPAFWVHFNWSHFVAWDPTNPQRVYQSVANDPDSFSWAWSRDYDFPENTVWLAATKSSLFYFTENAIHRTWADDVQNVSWVFVYSNKPLSVKEWSAWHFTIAVAWNNVYYLTPTNKIKQINITDWWDYQTIELSHREDWGIADIMDSLDNDQSNWSAVYNSKENIITWHLKSTWAAFNDVAIVYSTERNIFLQDSNKFFSWWCELNWVSYAISNIEKKVYKTEFGQTDDDTPVLFEYWTKNFALGEVSREKELWEIRQMIQMNELAIVTVEVWVDWALVHTETITWSTISQAAAWIWTFPIWTQAIWWTWIDSDMFDVVTIITEWSLQVKGKKIQLKYKCSTLAGKVTLSAADLRIELLNPLA